MLYNLTFFETENVLFYKLKFTIETISYNCQDVILDKLHKWIWGVPKFLTLSQHCTISYTKIQIPLNLENIDYSQGGSYFISK